MGCALVGLTGGLCYRIIEGNSESEIILKYYLGGIVVGSAWSLVYFAKHRIGYKIVSHDLSGLSHGEKYKRLKDVLFKKIGK